MGFIYKITNKINGKCYIGKTEKSVEQRFKEHISDSKKERCKNRPLYRAMDKYGVENFILELVEICDNTEEREIYWIEFYKSYGASGYNATKGGDGTPYIDYEFALDFYRKNYKDISVVEMSRILNIDYSGFCRYLNTRGFDLIKNKRYRVETKRKVMCIDTGEIFESLSCAATYVINLHNYKTHIDGAANKISLVCRNKRKTAFKYKWMFV